ncbi:uncharacterized protein LOC103851410 [Brassica rapa]|uniref:Uncharacterized protein n=3 Tax=Brassica TaxID=3705 RepID=A0ABQ8AUG0_BRANA|nr:uncharacterized protein LOC103851410 [Brassica rapa]XP_013660432.1 protein OXIDATIVE STRESS 3 LIKE 2 [Brassica napus]KAH0896118.1 hypothetical protein HID58_045686 [Brassica napus]CAF2367170.1 unnamed protein product [Brassica napus]CAG7892059.1 unnamed protein product [Brassica rapa]CDY09110.1 BnaA02g05360D [Brassica napus]VDC86059.1 unnamed protein product [Brassica rapa]
MDRVESYVFDISGDSLYQSSSSESFSSPSSSSAASSSIGKNSDDEEDFHGGEGEENEAESTYKGPLALMESLEEVLPVRKGISSFYNGKSKSFTNLAAEAASALTSSSSMKDLVAKPENPYSRRRRNLLCHQIWENNNKKTTPRGGISKKHVMSSSRSALTLAMAVAAGEGSSSGGDSSQGSSPSPPRQRHHQTMMMMLPPLYPRSQGSVGNLKSSQSSLEFCALRSYSVADISRCFPSTASGLGASDS